MHKGQIFSLDLIMALVLAVLSIALLTNAMEFNSLQTTQSTEKVLLEEKADAALIVLTNGLYSCEFDGTKIAYSIDEQKLNSLTPNEIAKNIGLVDYNVAIQVGNVLKQKGSIDTNNNLSSTIDIFYCTDSTALTFKDIESCLETGACVKAIKRELTMVVNK